MSIYKNRVIETGDGTLAVELTRGFFAIVDDAEDIRKILAENHFICDIAPSTGAPYAVSGVYDPSTQKQHRVYLHQFIIPKIPGKVVDRINRDTLDNRRANLRSVSRSINSINSKIRHNNRTGVVGLSRLTTEDCWYIKWNPEPKKTRSKRFLDRKYGGKEQSKSAATAFLMAEKLKLDRYVEGAATGITALK